MNQVIEIPDTPDRLVATKHNKDRNTIVGRSDGSINKQPMPTKISIICNGIKRLISSPTSCSESPILKYFRKTKPTIDIDRYDKGKALANTEVQKSTRKVNGHGQSERGVLPLTNFPAIVSLDGSSKSSKVESMPKNGPTFDSEKGVVVVAENNTQPSTFSNVYQRKKLVRNECVPPLNIEKSKKVVVKCENPSVVKEITSGSGTVASDGGSSIVDIKDEVAEDDSRRHKGKEISNQFSSEEANAGNSHLSQRERIHKDPAESSTDIGVGANGWRTTHNQWKQRDIKQQKNETMESDHKNETDIKHLADSAKTSSHTCDLPNANESGINRQTESSTSRNRGKRPISCIEDSVGQPSTLTSKRKQRDIKQQKTEMVQRNHNNVIEIIDLDDSPITSSRVHDIPNADELGINGQTESFTLRNRGKRPISCIDDSVGQPSTSRPKRSKNLSGPRPKRNNNLSGPSTSNPVSEPNRQIHGNDEDLSVRAFQIEQDAILAEELQKQIYDEEPLYNHQHNYLPSAGVHHAPLTGSNSSDMRMLNDLLQEREFNENDYEMLLALDEDNYKHQGATRTQINSLPESTVQAENTLECTICLEGSTIGEKIRHLPCLHKFHKKCVDKWLSRRASCPVCKTSVDLIG